MSESYTTTQQDLRTFGEQQARLLDDLNRPDLSGVVIRYLQDAMRYYQRMPFFFSDTDNTAVPAWAANTIYPQGSTITFVDSVSGHTFIAVALNMGTSGATIPAFPTTLFVVPSGVSSIFPPPAVGTSGTVQDSSIIWATVTDATANSQTVNYWTQLSTVYNTGQYTPPIDYVAPRLVEITIPNLRIPLIPISYPELRSYDVIRPNVVSSYPAWWAWYEQQIFMYPYPQGFYPLTLSYRTSPQLVVNASDTNMWTTKAEALVRCYAEGLIQERVLKDPEAAQLAFSAAQREFNAIRSQGISQAVTQNIPATDW